MPQRPPAVRDPRFPWFSILMIAFAVVGSFTALVEDYRNSRRGEPSFVFRPPAERAPEKAEKAPVSKEPPREKPRESPAAKPKPEAPVPVVEPRKEAPPPAPAQAAPAFAGQVALVVDDMGNSLDALDDLISIGLPLTIAVLPDSEHPRETAERAAAAGLEVLLHLPLESANGNGGGSIGSGLIASGMPTDEILRTIAAGIDAVPGIRGVNNHMGSKVTTDPDMMRIILPPLRDRGLFFLDSLTSGRSVAYDEALRLGMPAARRDVFLDADGDGARAGERLRELFQAARRHGRAIGICHPFPATLAALKSDFPLIAVYGLEAVPVSRLARR
jgi:polysaccharide deacetylase 2 family uncharacterized protein YibQ